MQKYRLKKGWERFTVVDGPLAGRSYVPDVCYPESDIPSGDRKRFEKVPQSKTAVTSKSGGKK